MASLVFLIFCITIIKYIHLKDKSEWAFSMLDAGCWMLDTGCWILDTGCWMLDAGYCDDKNSAHLCFLSASPCN